MKKLAGSSFLAGLCGLVEGERSRVSIDFLESLVVSRGASALRPKIPDPLLSFRWLFSSKAGLTGIDHTTTRWPKI